MSHEHHRPARGRTFYADDGLIDALAGAQMAPDFEGA
jgi:hypothetical protein